MFSTRGVMRYPPIFNLKLINMKLNRLWHILSLFVIIVSSMSFTACGGSDDDGGGDTAPVPKELIGQWYNTSNSTYSMNFTFKNDGTGTGEISHNRIISFSTFAFSYTYSSNGDITCVGKRAMVDEENAETVDTRLVFHYDKSTKRLTLTDGDNGNWHGAVFEKTGVDYSGIDNGEAGDTGTNAPSTFPTGTYYASNANETKDRVEDYLSFGDFVGARNVIETNNDGYAACNAAIEVAKGDKIAWITVHSSLKRPSSDAILVETKTYSYQSKSFTAYFYLYEHGYVYFSDQWFDAKDAGFKYANGQITLGKSVYKKVK